MASMTLVERIVCLDDSLAEHPHAFGGALALAYYAEPRATVDFDVNIFVPSDQFAHVAGRLSSIGLDVGDAETVRIVSRDGQVRLFWDETPNDLFLSYDAFHDAAAAGRRRVPFADRTMEVLSAEHLIVRKVICNRSKDWVDVEAVLDGDAAIDAAEMIRWVGRIAGDEDARYVRIVALLSHR